MAEGLSEEAVEANNEARAPRRWLESPWFPLLLLPVFVLLYAVNARTALVGDSQAHLYLAASFAWSGDADLGEYRAQLITTGGGALPYFVIESGGGLRSIFNFFPALLLVPFYWVAGLVGGEAFRGSVHAWGMVGKLAASLCVFAAGFPLWALLRRRVGARLAAVVLMAFWFATPLWAGSVDYLQHQPLMVFKLGALWALFGGKDKGRVGSFRPGADMVASADNGYRPRFFLGGLLLALSVLCRYQTFPSAVVIAAAAAVAHARTPGFWKFIVGGLAPLPIALWYHAVAFGSPFRVGPGIWLQFDHPFWETTAALLLNPSRGLVVHSPWIVGGIVLWMWRVLRNLPPRASWRLVPVAALSAVPTFLLYSKLNGWYGGWCWGYRYLADLLPEMVILAAAGWSRVGSGEWGVGSGEPGVGNQLRKWVLVVLVAASFGVQSVGALAYDNEWSRIHDQGGEPSQAWLWQLEQSEPCFYAKRRVIYLGFKRIELGPSPYAERGFYAEEDWGGGRRVRWTGEDASFLFVAKRYPSEFWFYPNPDSAKTGIVHLDMRLNGRPAGGYDLIAGQWLMVPLPMIPWQHSAVVELHVTPTYKEGGEGGRVLGVAMDVGGTGM